MEFTFRVWSNRWGHHDVYTLEKLSDGWDLQHMAHSGHCDAECEPHLVANFDQDNINYPSSVGSFMGFIWQQLDSGEIDAARAQEMIQEVADWVSRCEQETPRFRGWNA